MHSAPVCPLPSHMHLPTCHSMKYITAPAFYFNSVFCQVYNDGHAPLWRTQPFHCLKNPLFWGWGFSSVVERLPRKHKALGSVPSSEKKKPKKKKNPLFCLGIPPSPSLVTFGLLPTSVILTLAWCFIVRMTIYSPFLLASNSHLSVRCAVRVFVTHF